VHFRLQFSSVHLSPSGSAVARIRTSDRDPAVLQCSPESFRWILTRGKTGGGVPAVLQCSPESFRGGISISRTVIPLGPLTRAVPPACGGCPLRPRVAVAQVHCVPPVRFRERRSGCHSLTPGKDFLHFRSVRPRPSDSPLLRSRILVMTMRLASRHCASVQSRSSSASRSRCDRPGWTPCLSSTR
jgi:hypothetical protein